MIELPKAFIEEMKELLGEEYPAYLATYERPVRQGAADKFTETDTGKMGGFGSLRM